VFSGTSSEPPPRPAPAQNPLPFVPVRMRQIQWFAATYSTVPSPPNAQFAVGTPVAMVPRCVPSGANTSTPPGPVANRFPSTSTFIPSGSPGFSLLPTHLLASKNTRPAPSVPSALTSNAIHTARLGSLLATYSVFSSGDSAIPLGRLISFVSSVSDPSLAETR